MQPFVLNTSGQNMTMWAADQGSAVHDVNVYASHPFYLQLSAAGAAHGVVSCVHVKVCAVVCLSS